MKTDAIFEFEKLKFEIEYLFKTLLTVPGEISCFDDRIKTIESKLPEWKDRVAQIKTASRKLN